MGDFRVDKFADREQACCPSSAPMPLPLGVGRDTDENGFQYVRRQDLSCGIESDPQKHDLEAWQRQLAALKLDLDERLDQFAEELKQQRCMVDLMLGRWASVADPPTTASNVQVSSDPEQAISDERRGVSYQRAKSAHLQDIGATYHFRRSIWDAAVFVGNPVLGKGGGAVVAILLLMCVGLQSMMCTVAYQDFAKTKYSDKFFEGLKVWRDTVGHEMRTLDQTFHTSLVTRVCDNVPWLELSERHGAIVSEVKHYLPEYSDTLITGPMFCMGCISMLFLGVFVEICHIFDFVHAITHLEHGFQPRTELLATGKGEVRVFSISRRRLIWIILLTIVRLFVCFMILFCGTRFLVATHTKSFLLLNSVKLMMILRVHELILALAPEKIRNLQDVLKPIHLEEVQLLKSTTGFILRLLTLIGWLALSSAFVRQECDLLRKAHDLLCGGHQNWVYGSMASGQPIWSWTESVPNYSTDGSYMGARSQFVMQQNSMLAKGIIPEVILGFATVSDMDGIFGINELLRLNVADYSDMFNGACVDTLQDSDIATQSLLQTSLGVDFKVCSDIAFACHLDTKDGIRMRMLCPVTCGCSAPNSTLVLSKPSAGCPKNCRDKELYHAILAAAPCSDPEPDELLNSSAWRSYADTVENFNWSPRHLTFFQILHELMRTRGCDVVKDFPALQLCSSDDNMAMPIKSFQLFCPESCACKNIWRRGCPLSCGPSTPP